MRISANIDTEISITRPMSRSSFSNEIFLIAPFFEFSVHLYGFPSLSPKKWTSFSDLLSAHAVNLLRPTETQLTNFASGLLNNQSKSNESSSCGSILTLKIQNTSVAPANSIMYSAI